MKTWSEEHQQFLQPGLRSNAFCKGKHPSCEYLNLVNTLLYMNPMMEQSQHSQPEDLLRFGNNSHLNLQELQGSSSWSHYKPTLNDPL